MATMPSQALGNAVPGISRHERFLGLFAKLEPGEGRCVLLFFGYAFLLLVCYYILKTLREPLLLEHGSAAAKSYAYATVALVLLVLVPLYGALFRRAARKRVTAWITIFFVANLGAFYVASCAGADIGFVYYVWVGVFGVTVVAQFWAHAADAFGVESGQRLFPAIMGGATLGGLAGPLVARFLYHAAEPQTLLLVAAALLGLTVPLVGITRDSVPAAARRKVSGSEQRFAHPLGGFALIFRNPYLLLLAALVVLLNCVNTTGEYILSELVIRHADEQVALQSSLDKGALIAEFYAEFFFAVNALTVIAQAFLVARVFRWVGVQGALLVLPVVSLVGYALVAFLPVFAILRVVKTVENATDYSITNTARQALYLPLPTEAKYEGKIATDTFFWRFGDLLQGGLIFAGLNWFGFEIEHFAILNMVLAAVWLVVAQRLARRYGAQAAPGRLRPLRVALARGWLSVAALAPRPVLARGAAVWLALFIGITAMTGSAPAKADLPPAAEAVRPGPFADLPRHRPCAKLPAATDNSQTRDFIPRRDLSGGRCA
jgi:AAA family ATP:ADP antiporter